RDEILPLIDVAEVLGRGERSLASHDGVGSKGRTLEAGNAGSVQVVVYAVPKGHVGLVVGNIEDIIEETIVTRARAKRAGVLFTAVIQGKVTEFIDIEGIIRAADPELFEQPTSV